MRDLSRQHRALPPDTSLRSFLVTTFGKVVARSGAPGMGHANKIQQGNIRKHRDWFCCSWGQQSCEDSGKVCKESWNDALDRFSDNSRMLLVCSEWWIVGDARPLCLHGTAKGLSTDGWRLMVFDEDDEAMKQLPILERSCNVYIWSG